MNLPPLLRILLWPLSILYAGAMWLRTSLYARGWLKQKRLDGRVVSVGNLTVGGTGKTPMVIWLAERFLAEGKRVAILSRGYRGSGKTSDEIELMKDRLQGRALFGVGKDRYAEGKRLQRAGVDIFLIDDGFQHLRLARDVDIVLIDSTHPLRQDSILPAGRLREPRSALHRADLVIFTRTEQSKPMVPAIQKSPQMATYMSTTKLLAFRDHASRTDLLPACPAPVFAFAGIGNPEAFFADLERWNVHLVGSKAFRDHHRYTKRELQELTAAAQSLGAKALMTTEKDAQNLDAGLLSGMPVHIAVVAMEIPDEGRFMRDLRERLALRSGVAA
ncbi:MAG TPA: tetraacyldisaccharide 4'-kinase [Candidatus Acidoferrum sp.]|nr:tetraacyldisaccharide 4'-kinase [Candidatus Acidoferrum sp.]